MREITELNNAMKVGASLTLVELEEIFKYQIKTKPGKSLNLYIFFLRASY
jgi:hypothetical protein